MSRLLIGTPCYNGLLHQDYVKSVIEFSNAKLPITYMHIGNESLITRGRNSIISFFFNNKENFDYLLFLDADVYLPIDGLFRLLNANKDVIAAPVPMKGTRPDGSKIYNVGKLVEDGDIPSVDHVGTAVFMLSTKAIVSLIDDCVQKGKTYTPSKLTRGAIQSQLQYDVFEVGVIDGEYVSEDFYLCHTLRKLGYQIHVDPDIIVRHTGMFTF